VRKTLPSPSTASPVNASPVGHEDEMVGRVAGQVQGGERAERITVAERGHRSDRHVAEPRPERRQALGMIRVVVCERYPARSSARRDRRGDGVEVRVQCRPRVHDPGRVASHDPGVGAVKRVRRGVRGRDEQDLHRAQRGTIRYTGPPSEVT
jgi:hypothetical protein